MLRILPFFEVRSINIRSHLSKRQPACIFFTFEIWTAVISGMGDYYEKNYRIKIRIDGVFPYQRNRIFYTYIAASCRCQIFLPSRNILLPGNRLRQRLVHYKICKSLAGKRRIRKNQADFNNSFRIDCLCCDSFGCILYLQITYAENAVSSGKIYMLCIYMSQNSRYL